MNIKTIAAAALTATALTFAAPAHASEATYVKYLRGLGGSEMFSDQDLLNIGYSACSDLRTMGSKKAVLAHYANDPDQFPSALLSLFIDAAHVHLCPELGE